MVVTTKLIRLVQPDDAKGMQPIVEVYMNTYRRDMYHLNQLFDIIKKDFPMLLYAGVNVGIYGGERRKGTMFLNAQIPSGAFVPADYEQIKTFEPRL